MLLRRDGDGRIAIAQPAHAALSGRLAAALHHLGWAAWERAPTVDPATGRPREFPQVSKRVHVGLWRDGVALAGLHGRRVALLVSRHADTIYARYARHYDLGAASLRERAAVDELSLRLCRGVDGPAEVADLPAATVAAELVPG